MGDFNTAFIRTMGHEGLYSNDSNDRGGETYMGIARLKNPTWEGWKIIDNLRVDKTFPKCLPSDSALQSLVKQIYKKEYFDPLNLDQIDSQDITNELFDTAVNMGVGTASRFLQRALNVLNRMGRTYSNIKVDGDIGQGTLEAYKKCDNKAGLLKALNGLQFMKYMEIVEKDEAQEKFMNGWLNRI